MVTRKMKNLGIDLSLLGFGCMRFPMNEGKIDELVATNMIKEAMAKGVNYIDTAYPYHNGASEPFVGRVLNEYERSSYYLATKLPMWLVNSVEDAKRLFEEQLERLDKTYIDFYLLHALNKGTWQKVLDYGIIEYCEQLQREGKIKYLGFSFHDDYEVFEEIATYRQWDFCQIQLNYMDTEEQAGEKGYDLTEHLGIPLVIMEPIKGGSLANFSDDINARFTAMDETASISSFALRWVASHPNVKVILSGMSTPEQVADNLNTFCNYKPMTEKEKEAINEIVGILRSRVQNGCTGCRYCMPCPAGVDIPFNFKLWNTYHIYRNYWAVNWDWERNLGKAKADACIKCGKCEQHCPQKIAIRKDLEQVMIDLENPKWKP